jgi:hypothetical protein
MNYKITFFLVTCCMFVTSGVNASENKHTNSYISGNENTYGDLASNSRSRSNSPSRSNSSDFKYANRGSFSSKEQKDKAKIKRTSSFNKGQYES